MYTLEVSGLLDWKYTETRKYFENFAWMPSVTVIKYATQYERNLIVIVLNNNVQTDCRPTNFFEFF